MSSPLSRRPLEEKLKEDTKSEISTLHAQIQVLLVSAKEEQAKSKEHNASMEDYVNLKNKEIAAIGGEVAKLKESNAQLDALTHAKDASLRAFMVEQKAEINQKFHAHDVSLQATISSGRDEFQRLHEALDRRVTSGETGASEGGGEGADSERMANSFFGSTIF